MGDRELRQALAIVAHRQLPYHGNQVDEETVDHLVEVLHQPLVAFLDVSVSTPGFAGQLDTTTGGYRGARVEVYYGEGYPVEADVLGGVLDRVRETVVDQLKSVRAL